MYCSKCGKGIPNESDFCPYCGNKVDKVVEAQKSTTSAAQKSYLKNPIIIGAIALTVVIAIVAVAIGFGGKKSDKNSSNGGYVDYKIAYSEILNEYKEAVQKIVVEETTYSATDWSYIQELYSVYGYEGDNFLYSISDINDNGTDELVLFVTKDNTYIQISKIYSLQDGKPYLLRDAPTYRHFLYIRDDGTIVAGYSAGAGNSTTAAYKLENNDLDLAMIEEYGAEDEGDGNRRSFRGFGGERTYYDGEDASFVYDFESDISKDNFDLEFNPILSFVISTTDTEENKNQTPNNENSNVEIDSSLPYYELAFSESDFKFAGYSLSDGDKRNEIYKVASQSLPMSGVTAKENQWVCSKRDTPDDYCISIYYNLNRFVTGNSYDQMNSSGAVYYRYMTYTSNPSVELQIKYEDEGRLGENIVGEYPLLNSIVLPEMSRSEAIGKLQLADLIDSTKNNGTSWKNDNFGSYGWEYEFRSQYGNSKCSVGFNDTKKTESIRIIVSNNEIKDYIDFDFKNDILCSIDYTRYFMNE